MEEKFFEVGFNLLAVANTFPQIVFLEIFDAAKTLNETFKIFINEADAYAIGLEIQKIKSPRPLTHDLFANFIGKYTDLDFKRVVIYDVFDNSFHAYIEFLKDGILQQEDCRPSDGIALALRLNIPIFAAKKLFFLQPDELQNSSVHSPAETGHSIH